MFIILHALNKFIILTIYEGDRLVTCDKLRTLFVAVHVTHVILAAQLHEDLECSPHLFFFF